MGICCTKKSKILNIDTYWEQLPIRQMSLIEFKKKFFVMNSINLKDLQNFEKFFQREELLTFGDMELQNTYKQMFLDDAKENDIYHFIFIFGGCVGNSVILWSKYQDSISLMKTEHK